MESGTARVASNVIMPTANMLPAHLSSLLPQKQEARPSHALFPRPRAGPLWKGGSSPGRQTVLWLRGRGTVDVALRTWNCVGPNRPQPCSTSPF